MGLWHSLHSDRTIHKLPEDLPGTNRTPPRPRQDRRALGRCGRDGAACPSARFRTAPLPKSRAGHA